MDFPLAYSNFINHDRAVRVLVQHYSLGVLHECTWQCKTTDRAHVSTAQAASLHAGGEDHAQIAIVLRDIKATLADFARAANDCDADAWNRLVGRLVNHQEQLDRRSDSLDDLENRMLAGQAPLWKSLASITGDDDLAHLLEEAETNAQVLMPKAGVDPGRADAVLEHVDDVLTKFPTDASAGNRICSRRHS